MIVLTIAMALALGAPRGQTPDSGNRAEGTLRVDGTTIPLKYVRAHLHDNAEGILERKKELRILLTDREVPASALDGLVFLPVWYMAIRGEVQGILIELDPADPNKLTSILLMKPKQPGRSLMTSTINMSGGNTFKDWKLRGDRVSGAIEQGKDGKSDNPDIPNVAYTIHFDAAVVPEHAVTQDLKGQQAIDSPQVKALALAADAMARADFPALKRLSTQRANERLDQMLARAVVQAKTFAKQEGMELQGALKKTRRVVVRGDRATVLMPAGSSMNLLHENGMWKLDD